MKIFTFSRKAILRAIHAASVALFLLAAQREAAAQSYTATFQVSGSTVTTNSGSFGTGETQWVNKTSSPNRPRAE